MEGVTRESLRPLLDLQRVDSGIDRLTHRRADLSEQRELDELAVRRAEVAAAHAEKQTQLDAAVREQSRLETDVQQLETKIEHEQKRLYSGDITSPKELSSIQAELDALRRRKAHLEDQDLEVMERREGLEGEAKELATSLAALDAGVAEATARRDEATTEIDGELARLSAERTRLIPSLPREIVEMYEDMRAKKSGVAVGALENGTCRACGLPLSPMAREEIRTSDDPIIRCENCRRLLVPV